MKHLFNIKAAIILLVLISSVIIGYKLWVHTEQQIQAQTKFWQFQSIDTMKYSRDLSRQNLTDPKFDIVIEQQVADIEKTGATHVAIATPYDEEFVPVLNRWVTIARRHNLKIWFRGNFSGWEGWFDYPSISRAQHLEKTQEFILKHPDLFEDGDVFTACPECENGGPGDPRTTGDTTGHRKFLIDEYKVTQQAFKKINKKVASNYASMNADVARLIMDQDTAQALGGIVVIDHYVKSPEQLNRDITSIAQNSHAQVVLGEFGAPVPDIHGDMTEQQQAHWLKETFDQISGNPYLIGVNYWVNMGGSTALWDDSGHKRLAVDTITQEYRPTIIRGSIHNVYSRPITNATIVINHIETASNLNGDFVIPTRAKDNTAIISAPGYNDVHILLDPAKKTSIVMEKKHMSIFEKIFLFFKPKHTIATPLAQPIMP